jgi:hypothetical protein
MISQLLFNQQNNSGLNEVYYENYAERRLLPLVLRLVRFAQPYPLDSDRKDGGGLRRLLYPATDHRSCLNGKEALLIIVEHHDRNLLLLLAFRESSGGTLAGKEGPWG